MGQRNELQGFAIRITTLINPHNFYFKLDNFLTTIEDEISDELNKKVTALKSKYPNGYEPERTGENVIVFVPDWSRWVRAEVDSIERIQFANYFTVWCTDYGFPMKVKVNHILPMYNDSESANFDETNSKLIFKGGLANCKPCAKDFEIFGEHIVQDWDDKTTETVKTLLLSAEEVRFFPLFSYGDRIFGDIKFITHGNSERDLAKELMMLKLAQVLPENYFYRDIDRMESLKKHRYETAMHSSSMIDLQSRLENPSFVDETKENNSRMGQTNNSRILEWVQNNVDAAIEEGKEKLTSFEEVIKELQDVSTIQSFHSKEDVRCSKISLCDSIAPSMISTCTNFDSVSLAGSMKNMRIKSLKTDTPSEMVAFMPAGAESELIEFLK